MTDEINKDDLDPKTQLHRLKRRADTLGITYPKNIGIERLSNLINDKLAENETPEETAAILNTKSASSSGVGLTEEKAQEVRHKNLARKMNKLVRVQIQCLNPEKRRWYGEWKTFGNKFVPSIRKFVAFGVAYHLPQGILNLLKDSVYRHTEVKMVNGIPTSKNVWKKEYIIHELDKLTPKELQDLARDQRLREGKE